MQQKPIAKRTSHLANAQEVAAERFPEAVAQGGVLVIAKEFSGL
jgi:hypothetical protein